MDEKKKWTEVYAYIKADDGWHWELVGKECTSSTLLKSCDLMACAHGVFYTRLGRFDRRVAVGIFNLPGTWGYAKSASVRVEFWDKASGGFIGFQCQYLRSDMASDLWKTVTVVADSLEKIGITLCVTDVVVWLARFVATVASTGVSASLLPLALIAGGFIAGVVAYSSGQLINWYYQSRVLHVSTNGFIPP